MTVSHSHGDHVSRRFSLACALKGGKLQDEVQGTPASMSTRGRKFRLLAQPLMSVSAGKDLGKKLILGWSRLRFMETNSLKSRKPSSHRLSCPALQRHVPYIVQIAVQMSGLQMAKMSPHYFQPRIIFVSLMASDRKKGPLASIGLFVAASR